MGVGELADVPVGAFAHGGEESVVHRVVSPPAGHKLVCKAGAILPRGAGFVRT
ncbi:MAG: hypothetical protein AMXMBFR58_37620 [Phycisphaerae bacterium]